MKATEEGLLTDVLTYKAPGTLYIYIVLTLKHNPSIQGPMYIISIQVYMTLLPCGDKYANIIWIGQVFVYFWAGCV